MYDICHPSVSNFLLNNQKDVSVLSTSIYVYKYSVLCVYKDSYFICSMFTVLSLMQTWM